MVKVTKSLSFASLAASNAKLKHDFILSYNSDDFTPEPPYT